MQEVLKNSLHVFAFHLMRRWSVGQKKITRIFFWMHKALKSRLGARHIIVAGAVLKLKLQPNLGVFFLKSQHVSFTSQFLFLVMT